MTYVETARKLEVIDGGVKEAKEPKELKEPRPSEIVGSTSWGSKVRKRAKELTKTLDTGYMELAEILYRVYDTPIDGDPKNPPIFTAWGYPTFAEYAEGELGMHRRKAERLRAIWYVLEVKLDGLPADLKCRIIKLGHSKVREVIRVLSVKNAQEWVEVAEKSSYNEVMNAIQKYRQELAEAALAMQATGSEADAETDDEDPHEGSNAVVPADPPKNYNEAQRAAAEQNPFDVLPTKTGVAVPEPEQLFYEHFAFYEDQAKNVRNALALAERMSKSSKKSHNLDLICTDFLANNNFPQSDREAVRAYIAKMERTIGCKLVAYDSDAGEVVYGVGTLEKMAKDAEEKDAEEKE